MTLGDDLLDVLPELRAEAESMMRDACMITREDPDGEPDDVTGERPRVQVYVGKCRVQALDPQEQTPEAGGHDYTVQRYRVDTPVGGFKPAKGDVATITASESDPHLAGRSYRVVALLHKTQATAYRLAVMDGPD